MIINNLIASARADGLFLSVASNGLQVEGEPDMVAKWVPTLKAHKPQIISRLTEARPQPMLPNYCVEASDQSERLRNQVLSLLTEDKNTYYAFVVGDDGKSSSVTVAVAIRGVATFQIVIPRSRYDPFVFLEFLENTKHPFPSRYMFH
jgi:hypothetical protein